MSHEPITKQPLDIAWQPVEDVFQMLKQRGISREFAEDALAEFVLYWSERGTRELAWGNKFYKHCIYEKARQPSAQQKQLQAARKPAALSENWEPSERAKAALLEQGIPPQFIRECSHEFVLYWRDRGDFSSTWNSKFVQNVRTRWSQEKGTRGRSLVHDLTDRSWAQ